MPKLFCTESLQNESSLKNKFRYNSLNLVSKQERIIKDLLLFHEQFWFGFGIKLAEAGCSSVVRTIASKTWRLTLKSLAGIFKEMLIFLKLIQGL